MVIEVIIKGIETVDELIDVLERLKKAGFKQDEIIIQFGSGSKDTVVLRPKEETEEG